MDHKENPTYLFHPKQLFVSVTGAKHNQGSYDALNQNLIRSNRLLHALLHMLMLINSVRGERVPGLCLVGCGYSNGVTL